MDNIKRIRELITVCNYYCNAYYNEDRSEISDKGYDDLYDELESLEKETGYLLSKSPTQNVQGKVLSCFQKVEHTEPMLSAEKSKDVDDVIKFIKGKECVISWKLDGLSIILRYDKGEFKQAITRGSGIEGEDVTHTVSKFLNIPLTISYKGYLELRGEGLITFENFKKINQKLIANGENPYSSPRNLAAGSVRQLDANITRRRGLIFIAFGIVKCDKDLNTKTDQFEFLEEQGFEVVYNYTINKSTVESYIELFGERVKVLPYLTDGLIIEYNDINYGKAQGVTGHHGKNMFAFKWKNDSYETTFIDIELNTTRTGICSITGIFQEVNIEGVKVTRASLHNVDIFEGLQLGEGDTISVIRANDVIPQIEDNSTRSGTCKINMECPTCNSELEIRKPMKARFLFCTNNYCPAKLLGKFEHFVSKDGMDIIGLSEATLEKFIDVGFLKTFDDIYKLGRYENAITKMDGFGIKSYDKLIKAINKSKNVKLDKYIYALGIPNVGRSASKTISKYFDSSWDKFEDACLAGFDFTVLEDFGQTMHDNIIDWYNNTGEQKMLFSLFNIVSIIKEEKKEVSVVKETIFKNKVVCVTGSFENYKPRKLLEEVIESLGGKVTGSVSAKTDFLITNDTDSGTKKNQAAQKFGVNIINEKDFNNMIK